MSSADEWSLTIPWEPWSKQRPRISKGGGRTHQPAADRKAEERTHEFLDDNWAYPTLTGNVWLTARFFRATRQVVDGDNLLKHLMDSATGVIWVNDAQVTAFTVAVELDRTNPRTEFWVETHETTMTRDYS